jgi:hypothetical protein
MTKRIRKPAVNPEMRRNWLKRSEENGESAPQIANTDRFDVRTVRKQIEAERQERERREARSVVLRQALEGHYEDLCGLAKKIDSALAGDGANLPTLRNDRLWSALREHLPRSTMWKNLDRWQRLQEEIKQSEGGLEKRIKQLVKDRSSVKFPVAPHEVGVTADIIWALSSHSRAVAEGRPGINMSTDFSTRPGDERTTGISLGEVLIGRIPDNQVVKVKEMLGHLLQEVTTLPEHDDMSRHLDEQRRVRRALDDELAIIMLRRIVPGRCKYCPL